MNKKKKFGCLWYLIFAIAIIVLAAYIFKGIAPKSFKMAKDEAIEHVFGISTTNSVKVDTVKLNDSILISPSPKAEPVSESVDTSLVVVPVNITDHAVHLMAKVNSVDMYFLIDTGCSDMQITSAEFFYMKHLGLISESDITGNATCIYADNSESECPVVKLKTVNIGGIELKDVECTIQENSESSLLLGQNVLKQLGEISIDYTNNKLKIKR